MRAFTNRLKLLGLVLVDIEYNIKVTGIKDLQVLKILHLIKTH